MKRMADEGRSPERASAPGRDSPGARPRATRGERLPLFWRLLEASFHRLYRIRNLTGDPGGLLAGNIVRYRGPELRLACGTVVRPGDAVLELHFRREPLLPLARQGDPARMGLGLLRLAERDLPRVAAALEEDPELREVRALHALTLFHRGIERFGFEVMPVESRPAAAWFTAWHRLLMARDHARGWRHVRENRERLVTRHVWISREELIRRHRSAACPPR